MFWQSTLLPASFRGAAFKIQGYSAAGGRRLAKFEFPDRDDGYAEDLGRRMPAHRVRGYVVGEAYGPARDALRAALDAAGPGTLVHPYLGVLTVLCDAYALDESLSDGGLATFEMQFVEPGILPSPVSTTDTASVLLGALDSIGAVLSGNFAALLPLLPGGLSGGLLPGVAATAIGAALGGLAAILPAALAALGSTALGGLAAAVSAMPATPSDPVATAAAVGAAFAQAAVAAVAAANPAYVAYDPVLGDSAAPGLPADPSYGLAALTGWAPPPGIAAPALTALVQGSATVALATVYAQTTFVSANAAQAAGTQLLAAIGTQIEMAADGDDDALYLAWQAVATVAAQDVAARILSLPLLGTYSTGASLPALVLAQRLYQDASRADELVLLNDAIHPLFMPPSGLALSA